MRKNLSGARKYSREFFESLTADLHKANLKTIEILLPVNQVGEDEYKISPEELLNRERNYPSLVLRAVNKRTNETLKILFINRNSKAAFMDDTFPSGESQPPGLYFQSPDPARAYAVFQFFYEYLSRPDTGGRCTPFLGHF
jgi:hypothetical protein